MGIGTPSAILRQFICPAADSKEETVCQRVGLDFRQQQLLCLRPPSHRHWLKTASNREHTSSTIPMDDRLELKLCTQVSGILALLLCATAESGIIPDSATCSKLFTKQQGVPNCNITKLSVKSHNPAADRVLTVHSSDCPSL